MRTALLVLVVSSGMAWEAVHADDPKAVIDKAIQAAGGSEKLARTAHLRAKATGTVNLGAEVPFTWEIAWRSPNQLRITAELKAQGQTVTLVQGFDGARGWVAANGVTRDVDGKKLEELQAQIHLRRILMLIPLVTDKTFELTTLEEADVNGKPAAGIKVTAPRQRDVRLYFDKESGLLVKIVRQVLNEGTMQLVEQEDFLSNHRETQGIKSARKETWQRSGVKVAELEYSELSYPASIDAVEFQRPESGVALNVPHNRTRDVIYGKKLGVALTMDVFAPRSNPNGAAIILVVSGGWVSDGRALNNVLIGHFVAEPLKRGYTVFAVFHGSQPKFTIPEAVADLNRSVRFIRHHAGDYRIDPNRIGITGGSAGGHLSLMQGMAGDTGNPQAEDPVDRESSRVQAVACLFPPTDFLNYGSDEKYAFGLDGILAAFRTAIDVRELDPKTFRLERPSDPKKDLDLARTVSPITHVSAEDPPTLIVHGDADRLVPIQQAERLVQKLKSTGVTAELLARKGRGHDFNGIDKDVTAMTDWFDKHLAKK